MNNSLMSSDRLLTIVIPVYNTEIKKLVRCLMSIPNNPNIYVNIYDDCSTKYVAEEVINKIIEENPMLSYIKKPGNKIIRLSENKGLGFVRNESISDLMEINPFSYVLFLDSDDEIDLYRNYFDINLLKIRTVNSIFFGLNIISDESINTEYYEKFLSQRMIPYLITPAMYQVNYLYSNLILFDESRRVFEDIVFSVKLWTDIISNKRDIRFIKFPIYNYYLEGVSLTRNKDKANSLIDDLNHWVDWMIDYYKSLNLDDPTLDKIRPYIFNRIRYEKIKVLSMKMEINGDLNKYKDDLSYLKPYKINNILN